jgi:nucleoside-diphosphate-sugar epimerase
MKILVTGATGFIGQQLVKRLIDDGNSVHVLYRDKNKLNALPKKNLTPFKGDILEKDSLKLAMKDCEQVYHLAACASVWVKNKNEYFDINFTGTLNVLETAIRCGAKKIIITSTAGVFGPSQNNEFVDENTGRHIDYFNEYERTKDYTDRYVIENYSKKIDVVTVCPTRVFGPGELSNSNAATKMIKMYYGRKWKFLPGNGKSIGNYVFIDDVIKGMLLAMQKGKTGERYILGGENLSFVDFFQEITCQTGKNYRLFRIPVWILMLLSQMMAFFAKAFGIKPLITPGWTSKYLHNWIVLSEKAKKELNYKPVSFSEGLKKTIKWIEKKEDKA